MRKELHTPFMSLRRACSPRGPYIRLRLVLAPSLNTWVTLSDCLDLLGPRCSQHENQDEKRRCLKGTLGEWKSQYRGTAVATTLDTWSVLLIAHGSCQRGWSARVFEGRDGGLPEF